MCRVRPGRGGVRSLVVAGWCGRPRLGHPLEQSRPAARGPGRRHSAGRRWAFLGGLGPVTQTRPQTRPHAGEARRRAGALVSPGIPAAALAAGAARPPGQPPQQTTRRPRTRTARPSSRASTAASRPASEPAPTGTLTGPTEQPTPTTRSGTPDPGTVALTSLRTAQAPEQPAARAGALTPPSRTAARAAARGCEQTTASAGTTGAAERATTSAAAGAGADAAPSVPGLG